MGRGSTELAELRLSLQRVLDQIDKLEKRKARRKPAAAPAAAATPARPADGRSADADQERGGGKGAKTKGKVPAAEDFSARGPRDVERDWRGRLR